MNNEEKMVEQIEKIIAKNDEVTIMKSVNASQPKKITKSYNRGSVENFFLGAIITIIVIGGVIVGIMIAK